VRTRNT